MDCDINKLVLLKLLLDFDILRIKVKSFVEETIHVGHVLQSRVQQLVVGSDQPENNITRNIKRRTPGAWSCLILSISSITCVRSKAIWWAVNRLARHREQRSLQLPRREQKQ